MPIVAVIFVCLVAFTVLAAGLGAAGKPRWYWWAALSSYVCSFLSSFSIGLLVLSLTFIFLSLAVGHSSRLVRTRWHSVTAIAISLGVWALAITTIDDSVLFLPFQLLDPWLSGGVSGGGFGVCTTESGILRCTHYPF